MMDLEKIKAGLTGCGSHSCFIKPPVGMGTNGQCTCLDDKTKMQRYIFITNHEITSLREQLEKAKKDGKPVTEKYSLSDAIQLCEDLLNPNMFGYSVTAEVRNRAREVLGLKGRE